MPCLIFYLGGENVKRILLLVLCASVLLTGCRNITFSVEDLLTSPVIAEEQTAIYQALTSGLGKSISLEYPYSGDYRSAIVLSDIDGIDGNEALAFYSETANESNVSVAVLDTDENGSWSLTCTASGVGSAIDKVIIHPLGKTVDIVIGYRAGAFDENQVRMYRYIGENLATIYENSYTVLERFDIDGCGEDELVLANKAGDYPMVSVIKSPDGVNYTPYELTLNYYAASIMSYSFGRLNETESALYLDILNEGGAVSTDIIYMSDDGLVSPTNEVFGLRELSRRPAGYLSIDYDGDGMIEIPTVSNFTGYQQNLSTSEYMTIWYEFDRDSMSLELKSNSYYSLTGAFVLTIPNRWLGLVTAKTDTQTGEVTFYKYDSAVSDISEMTPIMSVVSSRESDSQKYTEDSGYRLAAHTDRRQYFVKTIADASEPLVLTNDEILDNLFCLE